MGYYSSYLPDVRKRHLVPRLKLAQGFLHCKEKVTRVGKEPQAKC
ncbi:hypothetical protein GGQ08_001480 [Salinibacter ruber]|nr:hypothetical protein [Salinibacter ruber]MCS3653440.1 hypothetical protein [Salinibacter ruber]